MKIYSLDNLVNDKTTSMGVAITFVVLYHLFCVDNANPLWKIFYPGFMGVDIFIFLSGYGLCFSINKNSISSFLKRRYSRILPVYFLMSILVTLISVWYGKNVTLWDLFCNISTLSYYLNGGGQFIDWYLSSLIVLYAIFPLFYRIIIRQTDMCATIIVGGLLVSLLIILSFMDLDWRYECCIGRIPLYLSGIVYYKKKSLYNKYIRPMYYICFLFSLVLYSTGHVHTYIVFYMLAPLFLQLVSVSIGIITLKSISISKCINMVGQISLEIYAANVVTMCFCSHLHMGAYLSVFYFSLLLGFTVLFVIFNKIIKIII